MGAEADDLRAAANRALLYANYEPNRIIVSPEEYRWLDMVDQIDEAKRSGLPQANRVRMQEEIADAFGIPRWLAGVEGYKPPWVRPRLRYYRRRASALLRRHARRLPGVHWWGPRSKGGWFEEAAEPRAGRWFLHVGCWRFGQGGS